ncbi:FAD-binding, type 2 [Xylariales sp. PMI_506]|nr:FAD-binding, type 2 [Xylariales sp. PMI_506]
MYLSIYIPISIVASLLAALPLVHASEQKVLGGKRDCRYLPGDVGWPTENEWHHLNESIGGRLIRGVPLGQPCHFLSDDTEQTKCAQIREFWALSEFYTGDPVNVMSPFWLNDSCSPFQGLGEGRCELGNLAAYAIDVDGADTVAAGIKFAQEKNIRLTIKNTGHDYIGRSTGRGSLALWTHNLKNIEFFTYHGPQYNGQALKAGAGVQFFEAYTSAAQRGLRVTGGYCPTVGLAGGYVQSGGHGPLAATYGMAADNVLEFEIVTVDGRHLVASAAENPDLYWALAGGGGGTFAVVLSVTMKAHPDGLISGAKLAFPNTNAEAYWAAIRAFHSRLLELNSIPGFSAGWGFNNQGFSLSISTLTGGTKSDIEAALEPFVKDLQKLKVPVLLFETTEHSGFYDHYQYYSLPTATYATNNTIAGRLVPRSVVEDDVTPLIEAFRKIVEDPEVSMRRVVGMSINVTHERVGNVPRANSVLPAWRDALYTLNVAIGFEPSAPPAELERIQVKANEWQALLREAAPQGGGYINEATFDNPSWKEDYFGDNYDRLLDIKMKYDPEFVLWQHTSVGTDVYWEITGEGRLCRL